IKDSSYYIDGEGDYLYTIVYISLSSSSYKQVDDDEELKSTLDNYIKKVIPVSRIANDGEPSIEYRVNPESTPIEGIVYAMPSGKTFIPRFGQPSTDKQYQCDVFMIMPFREDIDKLYTDIIVPTITSIKKNGKSLLIQHGGNPYSPEDIIHDIWSMINACELIIADCTDLNPNVFYELGMAHTIGKPAIVLTQDIKSLPFDIRHRRAIVYSTGFDKINKLRTDLTEAVQKILKLDG
ncbi:MAG: nucleoside 2-deoxyribosyltransferase, partial [Anaerolineae bacterium]|nr:nucleoside 2-deoxyribosyltransferase [Anaerolineae bacterium]